MKPRKQRLQSAELRRLDNIADALDRIATAIEHTSTRTEIDRVYNRFNIGEGVGLQVGGQTAVSDTRTNTDKYENFAPQGIAAKNIGNVDRSIEVDSDNNDISQVTEDGGNNYNNSPHHEVTGNSEAFNTNANDVVKDLSSALTNKHNKHKEP